ncbi:MAG: hypothetical protein ACT4QF_20605 [Sporichthyaceae bacterium]
MTRNREPATGPRARWRTGGVPVLGATGVLLISSLLVPTRDARAAVSDPCHEGPPQEAVQVVPQDETHSPPAPPPQFRSNAPTGPLVPGDECGSSHPSSKDPNPNTNPNRIEKAPPPLPGMDPDTATAVCLPGKTCTVSPPPGPDSRFRIDAAGGNERTVLFGTTNGNYREASIRRGPNGRPDCPDYRERNSDWVQFGFLEPKTGATWRKSSAMTLRQKLSESAAEALAKKIQLCFAAPYEFPTRTGYRLGRDGRDRVGVLPECDTTGSRTTNGRVAPCVFLREAVQVKGGWVVRLSFRIPANARDPKALG